MSTIPNTIDLEKNNVRLNLFLCLAVNDKRAIATPDVSEVLYNHEWGCQFQDVISFRNVSINEDLNNEDLF